MPRVIVSTAGGPVGGTGNITIQTGVNYAGGGVGGDLYLLAHDAIVVNSNAPITFGGDSGLYMYAGWRGSTAFSNPDGTTVGTYTDSFNEVNTIVNLAGSTGTITIGANSAIDVGGDLYLVGNQNITANSALTADENVYIWNSDDNGLDSASNDSEDISLQQVTGANISITAGEDANINQSLTSEGILKIWSGDRPNSGHDGKINFNPAGLTLTAGTSLNLRSNTGKQGGAQIGSQMQTNVLLDYFGADDSFDDVWISGFSETNIQMLANQALKTSGIIVQANGDLNINAKSVTAVTGGVLFTAGEDITIRSSLVSGEYISMIAAAFDDTYNKVGQLIFDPTGGGNVTLELGSTLNNIWYINDNLLPLFNFFSQGKDAGGGRGDFGTTVGGGQVLFALRDAAAGTSKMEFAGFDDVEVRTANATEPLRIQGDFLVHDHTGNVRVRNNLIVNNDQAQFVTDADGRVSTGSIRIFDAITDNFGALTGNVTFDRGVQTTSTRAGDGDIYIEAPNNISIGADANNKNIVAEGDVTLYAGNWQDSPSATTRDFLVNGTIGLFNTNAGQGANLNVQVAGDSDILMRSGTSNGTAAGTRTNLTLNSLTYLGGASGASSIDIGGFNNIDLQATDTNATRASGAITLWAAGLTGIDETIRSDNSNVTIRSYGGVRLGGDVYAGKSIYVDTVDNNDGTDPILQTLGQGKIDLVEVANKTTFTFGNSLTLLSGLGGGVKGNFFNADFAYVGAATQYTGNITLDGFRDIVLDMDPAAPNALKAQGTITFSNVADIQVRTNVLADTFTVQNAASLNTVTDPDTAQPSFITANTLAIGGLSHNDTGSAASDAIFGAGGAGTAVTSSTVNTQVNQLQLSSTSNGNVSINEFDSLNVTALTGIGQGSGGGLSLRAQGDLVFTGGANINVSLLGSGALTLIADAQLSSIFAGTPRWARARAATIAARSARPAARRRRSSPPPAAP